MTINDAADLAAYLGRPVDQRALARRWRVRRPPDSAGSQHTRAGACIIIGSMRRLPIPSQRLCRVDEGELMIPRMTVVADGCVHPVRAGGTGASSGRYNLIAAGLACGGVPVLLFP